MAEDDDLRGAVPLPPPPAPSRRDAAIGEAMRRFEGRPLPSEQPRRPPSATGWIRRPQMAALVTVGLMAVIGVPAAWIAVERHGGVESGLSRTVAPVAPHYKAVEPEHATAEPAPPGPPPARNAQPASAPIAPARRPEAQPERKVAEPEVRMSPPVVVATAPPIQAFAPVVMAPPPPPPPPAPAAAMARAAGTDLVVTGSRIVVARADGGDWNACTIDDPRRSLTLCQAALDPAAPGHDGLASARVADGLSRAWQGDLPGATQAFDAAIEVAPQSAQAYLNRSLAYAKRGDDARALADADAAIRYAPESAQAYYARSLLLRRLGKTGRARADERRAVAIDPRYGALIAP